MTEFKDGDRVRLKDDDTIMTVHDIHNGNVYCWWVDHNVVQRNYFPIENLEIVASD